jgi:hypothetical protein
MAQAKKFAGRLLVSLICILVWTGVGTNAFAATATEVCENSTWSNCGAAVRAELDRKPTDPKTIIMLANAWAGSYDKQYNWLRSKGQLQKSVPDSEKIFDELRSKVDPLDIVADKVKDKVIETAVKRYFSRLAPLVVIASGPIGQALKAFFTSSDIATDYDELRLMNEDIQARVSALLAPYLKPDWKSMLTNAVQQAVPSLKQN